MSRDAAALVALVVVNLLLVAAVLRLIRAADILARMLGRIFAEAQEPSVN